jgi:branched-chain amino acid transport system substrate-binding protein
MLQDPVDYKFTAFNTYYDQIKAGIAHLVKAEGVKTVCAMYIPSDFGLEIKEGTEDYAKTASLKYAAETTHKPDDADFVGSLTKLKDSGCDLVSLALGIRQTVTAVATAKKIGWANVKFLTSSAGFHAAVAQAPGGITEGLYASAGWADPVNRMNVPEVKAWYDKYKAAYNEEPGSGALLGYTGAQLLVAGLQAAGKDLTADSFKKGMESVAYNDPLTDNAVKFSPTKHQGADTSIISVVKGGNWTQIARVEPDAKPKTQ